MDRIVIGLTGSLASGKGTIASHFKDLGFTYDILSDRVREEVRSRGQVITRTILQDVGNEMRETYGGQVLAERTVSLLGNAPGNWIIDSIRNPEEILYLQKHLGAVIIGVDAPVEKRCMWYLERAKERGEDGTTISDFEKHNNRDFGIGESANGQQVKRCLDMADVVFDNNGTKADLNAQCDLFLKEFFGFDPEIHASHPERR